MKKQDFVTFLSDYGLEDEFVGVCHAVMLRIAPHVRVIDVHHNILRQDIRHGAVVLRQSIPYLPESVHLAVVDPSVGSNRRAIALETGRGETFVGPDNGLLMPAAERFGGVVEAIDVGHSSLRRQPVSASFHGRDVFAPVAAGLAAGVALAQAGEPLDPSELVKLELPRARLTGEGLRAHVLQADGYGNVGLDAERAQVAEAGLRPGGAVTVNGRPALYATTFADAPAGGLLLYEDGFRELALAVNRGSALAALELELDDEVLIAPAP